MCPKAKTQGGEEGEKEEDEAKNPLLLPKS